MSAYPPHTRVNLDFEFGGGDLVCKKLTEFGFGLYAARQYVAQRPTSAYQFIELDAPPNELPQQKWSLEEMGERSTALSTADMDTQLAAVRAGLGVAALPHFMAAPYAGELSPVPSKRGGPRRGVWLVVHKDMRSVPLVRTMTFLSEASGDVG